MSVVNESKIIVALDFSTEPAAKAFVDTIDPQLCKIKIGKELFTATGPGLVRYLVDRGFDVFLDLKYHDIPQTVGHACMAAADLGVWMLNVHASGGRRMMEEASNRLARLDSRPLLIAVTVLTSMEQNDLVEVGVGLPPQEQVTHLAQLSAEAGLDGVVCSAHEASALREQFGQDFSLVCPGIRPMTAEKDDQRRIMTPEKAISAGASYLVIGRPITQAADPLAVLRQIKSEITDINTL